MFSSSLSAGTKIPSQMTPLATLWSISMTCRCVSSGAQLTLISFIKPNVPREQWYKLDHVPTGELRIVLTLLVEGGAVASGPTPTPTTALAESAKPGGIVKTAMGVRISAVSFSLALRQISCL